MGRDRQGVVPSLRAKLAGTGPNTCFLFLFLQVFLNVLLSVQDVLHSGAIGSLPECRRFTTGVQNVTTRRRLTAPSSLERFDK